MADGIRSSRFGLPLPAALLAAVPVQAQIVTAGSVGPKVNLRGGQIEIAADLGSRRGDNLFHRFGTFSIASGQTAAFAGSGTIRNVISPVTGGGISNIDGTFLDTAENERISEDWNDTDIEIVASSRILRGKSLFFENFEKSSSLLAKIACQPADEFR
jgi:hypothetical protein